MTRTLWLDTLHSVWQHRAALPMLWAVPALLLLGTGLWDMILWRQSAAYEFGTGLESALPLTLGLIGAVGLIAVRWHRLVIATEQPGLVLGSAPVKSIGRYVLDWFVIGLVVGVIVILPLFAAISLMQQVFLFETGGGLLSFWDPLSIIGTALFIYVFSRMAMSLPHVAVTGQVIGLRASWRATRGAARGLITAAILASVAQYVIYGLPFWLSNPLYDDGTWLLPLWIDLVLVLVGTMTELVVITVGASLLTQLYRGLPSEARRLDP